MSQKPFSKSRHRPRQSERGNVLWFILITIALLSALTMMLTRSGSSINQSGDVEQLRIKATQIMRYASSIEAAIERLKVINNCSENEISFENLIVASYANPKSPSDESCHIFEPAGAGLEWRTFAPDALNAAGNNMAFVNGFRIEGVGSRGPIKGAEILMAAKLPQTLCERINIEQGISTTASDLTVTKSDWDTFYIGTFEDSFIINAGGEAPALVKRQTGCMIDANGDYVFYHAVLVR